MTSEDLANLDNNFRQWLETADSLDPPALVSDSNSFVTEIVSEHLGFTHVLTFSRQMPFTTGSPQTSHSPPVFIFLLTSSTEFPHHPKHLSRQNTSGK